MPSTLLERNRGIARRAGDLSAAAGRIRGILAAGKREQLLAGVDAAGMPFAPLSPATLRRPRANPTPLVPDGPNSGLIAGYVVEATAEPGRIAVSAGWPGRGYVRYLRSGTRRMPARDPGGFRPADTDACRAAIRGHVMGGRDGG